MTEFVIGDTMQVRGSHYKNLNDHKFIVIFKADNTLYFRRSRSGFDQVFEGHAIRTRMVLIEKFPRRFMGFN